MVSSIQSFHNVGGLLVGGNDARSFLQGQLSNDVDQLAAHPCQLTSLSNAKGRVIAVAYLLTLDQDLLLILPADLADSVLHYLERFVFRDRVNLSRPELKIGGVLGKPQVQGLPGITTIPLDPAGSMTWVIHRGNQWPVATSTDEAWQQQWLRSGRGWITAATSEQFVAQMVNLDLLDGISWSKGCYTGQEIIARIRYRGTNKRRMLGFSVNTCADVQPGTEILSNARRVGTVVSVVGNGNQKELLAVVQLNALDKELIVQGDEQGVLRPFELPYAIPELTASQD